MQEDKQEITAAEAARMRPVDARKLAGVEGGFRHEEGKHTWADFSGEPWPGSTGRLRSLLDVV